ncbi:beta-galactosidase [Candidatus Nomurabacteria bacterium]|nr:beta-galactosidase [Candidatus Kaiserbacteria bacterium]MCB9813809.1 beta-galactosidase [Candidatus Nomurabacteria bacterium]
MWKKILYVVIGFVTLSSFAVFVLAQKDVPKNITYGMSFNTLYARELGLNWQETYDAILDDLQVRNLRLAAHWPMVEPAPNVYNFVELDYQVKRAEEVGANVIMAVGRRLPRWPECHVPEWAREIDAKERDAAQLRYMEAVIARYQSSPAVIIWQVENEPFLEVFAFEYCGKLDENFLDQEIALVHKLDPTRQILVTDSGNLGTWKGAYSRGDIFGTSVYVHFWNPELGQFKTVLPPWAYRVKDNLMGVFYGRKPSYLIELSAEPWLLEPITEVPLETQFTRMNLEKFEDILTYAKDTRFDTQYLWGAEWWYWLKQQGHSEMWERGRRLFVSEPLDETKEVRE